MKDIYYQLLIYTIFMFSVAVLVFGRTGGCK